MSNIQFRVAAANDATLVRTFIESAFRADDTRPNWVNDRGFGKNFCIDAETVNFTIAHPDKDWLLFSQPVTEDGLLRHSLVGCCGVRLQKPGVARLSMLSVASSLQGNGVGRIVVAEAERFARQKWNAKFMQLNAIDERDLLIGWYERQGYVKTGEVEVYQLDVIGEMRFLIMEKNLA